MYLTEKQHKFFCFIDYCTIFIVKIPTYMPISSFIDHTNLKPSATERDIIKLCEEAKQHGLYTVCVASGFVHLAKQVLHKSSVKICTVVGFPLGNSSTKSKVAEAVQAIEDGAEEIDMVINISRLKSKNYLYVFKDIVDVKKAIGNKTLKVIIEISELSKNEIIKACEICIDAKANFVKTSTGFSKSGATLAAVKIMKKTVKDNIKIKASGGISDYDTAMKYIEAGVSRIGTSNGVKIVTEALAHQAI